jgi:hypothetical protein
MNNTGEGGGRGTHDTVRQEPIWQSIPQDLKNLDQWVVWKLEHPPNRAKPTKPPYDPKTGKNAKSNDPTTWSTFETAQRAFLKNPQWDGVGFMFINDKKYTGIDLDNCIDSQENIASWAMEIIKKLDSYTELTPSKRGVHIILRNSLKPGTKAKAIIKIDGNIVGAIEIYEHGRYFTVTGKHLPNTPTTIQENRSNELAEIYYQYLEAQNESELLTLPDTQQISVEEELSEKDNHTQTTPQQVSSITRLTSEEVQILSQIIAKEGTPFELLWEGKWQMAGYPSQSEADLAICGMLTRTLPNNPRLIDKLFRLSGMYRAKWDELHGQQTYGQHTIQIAITNHESFLNNHRKVCLYCHKEILFLEGKAVNLEDKSPHRCEEFQKEHQIKTDGETKPSPQQTRLDLKTAFDLATPLPNLDFVLPGLLAGTVGMIAAPGGTGKTFWLLQAAISIASYEQRIPFFGSVWEPPSCNRRVVLLLAEDPLDILAHRVRAISKWLSSSYNIPQLTKALENNLEIHSLIGYQPCLIDSNGEPNQQWLDFVKEAAEGTRLLGLDPLRRWHRGDEIDNGVMMYLIQLLEGISRESGCTILLSHHVNKASILSGTGGEQSAARGASAITDGVRWQLNLTKMSKEDANKFQVQENMRSHFVRMEITKSNYGAPLEPVWLRRLEDGILVKAHLPTPNRKEKPRYEKEMEEFTT